MSDERMCEGLQFGALPVPGFVNLTRLEDDSSGFARKLTFIIEPLRFMTDKWQQLYVHICHVMYLYAVAHCANTHLPTDLSCVDLPDFDFLGR